MAQPTSSPISSVYLIFAILILFAILAFIIFVSVYATIYSVRQGDIAQTTQHIKLNEPVGVGYQCRDYECADGLVCDPINQVCRKADGQPCSDGYDCLSTSYCSGFCYNRESTPPTYEYTIDIANGPCPCGDGMRCITDEKTGARICKRETGQSCQSGTECMSSRCLFNLCTGGLEAGEVCTQDSECTDGTICSSGYCQNPETPTGTAGAVCEFDDEVPGCNPGNTCIDKKCVNSIQGIGNSCNITNSTCGQPTTCVDANDFSPCTADDVSCVCVYPYTESGSTYYPDPNNGNLAQIGQSCIDDETSVGVCSDSGATYRAIFHQYTSLTEEVTTYDATQAIGSYKIEYEKISTYIPENPVSRLIGHDDVIYYVIEGDEDYPNTTGVIGIDGQVLIRGYFDTLIQQTSTQNTVNYYRLVTAVTDRRGIIYGVFDLRQTVEDSETRNVLSSKSNRVVYTYQPGGLFEPFNPQPLKSGLLGTPYYGNSTINVTYIDVSYQDHVLYFNGSEVFVKDLDSVDTRVLVGSDSGDAYHLDSDAKPQFYSNLIALFDNPNYVCRGNCPSWVNVAFLSDLTLKIDGHKHDAGKLIQFNGDARGGAAPIFHYADEDGNIVGVSNNDVRDFCVYSTTETGIGGSVITCIALDRATNRFITYITVGGYSIALPAYYGEGSKVRVTATGFYIYSPKTVE